MKQINLCYSPDNNYSIPCAVSINSILSNIKENISICIYILDGGLSDYNRHLLKQIIDLYPNANMKFIKVDDNQYKTFYTKAWKTSATYRFNIGKLLSNVDKVLYIDCDVVSNKSIEELYDVELGNNVMGMVPDIWYKKQLKRFDNKKQPYFNTGVCLFNLELWRKENISEKLINYYNNNKKNIIYPDQDPINVILDGKIKELDYKYNWCWHWEKNEYFDERGEVKQEDAALIHYIFNKPWWSANIHIASKKYFDCIESIPAKIRKPYSKYHTKFVIDKKSVYLFNFLPIYKKKNFYNQIRYTLFSFIPLLKIKRTYGKDKYYLFNLLPILKIKNRNNLRWDLELVKDIARYQ